LIIRSLYLNNFRCYKNFSIVFNERLTVLVGVNGSGKTTVLDAIKICFSMTDINNPIENLEIKIPLDDVSLDSKPEDITYQVGIQDKYHFDGETDIIPFKIQNINDLYISLTYFNNHDNYFNIINKNKPLCVAYMSNRFINNDEFILRNNKPSYSYSMLSDNNNTINYASTLEWFNNVDADEARSIRDNGQKNEHPELRAVREALSKALLGQFERPRMKGNPPELIIYKKGSDQSYKISQLSDGYRSMLAMVMDLARRMAQIHSITGEPYKPILHTPAIVLIDEIELHLHPSWQQTVLTTLMEIFPNTQFIVTTHSPQVLTSIKPQHIRILSDGKAYTVNEQTEGAESSRLMKHIFNVDQRPQNIEIVKALRDYSELVINDQYDTEEAVLLRKRLDEHFGNDDLELIDLDLRIENNKWE